jgi:hypothetical protein
MLTTIKPIFGINDTGCYADNSRGHYIGCVVIDLACEHGWLVDGEQGDWGLWSVDSEEEGNEGE